MQAILNDKYYNVEEEKSKYLVQTHSQTKDSEIKVPEVHGVKEGCRSKVKTRMDSKKISEISREGLE